MANTALKTKMRAYGIRALMRETKLSQHTIEAVLSGCRVRRATLRRLVVALEGG